MKASEPYTIKNRVLEFDGFNLHGSEYLDHNDSLVSFKFMAHMMKLLEDYDTVKKELAVFKAQFYKEHPNGLCATTTRGR